MSELKVTIQIEQILEVENGESGNGAWSKVSFIGTEVEGNYPKEIGFEVFGTEKVEKFQQYNSVGDTVEVSFNLQSREYNGKIYTTAQAWKVWNTESKTQAAPDDTEGEDLPF